MKRLLSAGIGLLGFVLLLAGSATAQAKSTYIVAPFSVQGPQSYAHLRSSLQQMLTSRLYWKDNVEPARQDLPSSVSAPANPGDAEKLRKQYKADYIVWGTVTVVGEDASLDVRVRDKNGKEWVQARETKAPQLISAVTGISQAINQEVFGRQGDPAVRTTGGPQSRERVNQMNPGINVNETSNRDVYLNPQFRYAGTTSEDESRLRSQSLNFSSIGMEVVDADGDRRNEIFLLDDRKIYAYRFEGAELRPLGEYAFPMTNQCLSVRSLPRPSGRAWIIVNAVDVSGTPSATILTFDGSNFSVEMKNVKYYLNVVKLPPAYTPVLVGQEAQPPRLFKGGVSEMVPQGKTLVPSKGVALPPDSNVFNFVWLPAGSGSSDGEKIITLNNSEQLRVHSNRFARISQTSESYSGSAVGLEIDPSMPGLGRDSVTLASMFYIPMRMLTVDLDRDGNYELVVNKPISTASQIFDRYRFFPQSEIHSLFWDGIGLNLQWKTRRIKGSMVDYAIADANNDGIPDLIACINTHPGALGVKARKTMVMVYPLDLSKTDPNTPITVDGNN